MCSIAVIPFEIELQIKKVDGFKNETEIEVNHPIEEKELNDIRQ